MQILKRNKTDDLDGKMREISFSHAVLFCGLIAFPALCILLCCIFLFVKKLMTISISHLLIQFSSLN